MRKDDMEGDFSGVLGFLGDLTRDIVISPLEAGKEEIEREAPYDLSAWASEGYNRPLSEYALAREKKFLLRVRNMEEHRHLEKVAGRMDNDVERYLFYFTTAVSSNMRRFIFSK